MNSERRWRTWAAFGTGSPRSKCKRPKNRPVRAEERLKMNRGACILLKAIVQTPDMSESVSQYFLARLVTVQTFCSRFAHFLTQTSKNDRFEPSKNVEMCHTVDASLDERAEMTGVACLRSSAFV